MKAIPSSSFIALLWTDISKELIHSKVAVYSIAVHWSDSLVKVLIRIKSYLVSPFEINLKPRTSKLS